MTLIYNQRPKSASGGYSLVELLVAVTVFSMMMLLMVQVLSEINKTTGHHMRQMEATASARIALDTLAQDISTLVTRGGTTLLFKQGDAESNDILRFVSISRNNADAANARMSIVSYSVENRKYPATQTEMPMLIRANTPLSWPDDSDNRADDYALDEALRDKPMVNTDIAAERVFRFEIMWLRTDGRITRDPRGLDNTDPDASTDGNGHIWVDLKQIRGFIVTVISLDGHNQQRVAEEEAFPALQSEFTTLGNTAQDSDKTPTDDWQQAIGTAEPNYARSNLRLQQRTYYIRSE